MVVQSVFTTVGLGSDGGFIVLAFGLVGGIAVTFALLMFIGFTALINDCCKRFSVFIKGKEKLYTKYGRTLIKAYKIIAVTSGGMYSIEHLTCLTVLGIISNVSGSVLISVQI